MLFRSVHDHDLREGFRLIKSLTKKPFGFNAIIQKTVKAYEDRMRAWIDIAIEEGVALIITALGAPGWVVQRAKPAGVPVFHNTVNRMHATKALEQGVQGLICVNNRAGGHLGAQSPQALYDELADLGVPLVCAGGIGAPEDFRRALEIGYAGVQMGTRFIATAECHVHDDYKAAIVKAKATDIVVTDMLDGVDCAVIRTPYFERAGTRAGFFSRWLLKGRFTKKAVRLLYALRGIWTLKHAARRGLGFRDVWQAGQSVEGVTDIVPAGDVVRLYHRHVVG